MGRGHTVDDTGVGCATRRNDVSARTHTERIDPASIDLCDERIGGVADIVNETGFADR